MRIALLNRITAITGKRIQHLRPVLFYPALFSLILITSSGLQAQHDQAAYLKTITERSAKILVSLSIKDSAVYNETLGLLVNQYSGLNTLQEQFKKDASALQATGAGKDSLLKKLTEEKAAKVKGLHETFVRSLATILSAEQVEKVKDGMTYSVFPKTYAAYLDMIPRLTEEEKQKIYDWLKEARELAMDGENADQKHAIFGKYKGRINNYLSARGYDMKKEGEEWQKRIKEKEKNRQQAAS